MSKKSIITLTILALVLSGGLFLFNNSSEKLDNKTEPEVSVNEEEPGLVGQDNSLEQKKETNKGLDLDEKYTPIFTSSNFVDKANDEGEDGYIFIEGTLSCLDKINNKIGPRFPKENSPLYEPENCRFGLVDLNDNLYDFNRYFNFSDDHLNNRMFKPFENNITVSLEAILLEYGDKSDLIVGELSMRRVLDWDF